MKRRTRGITTGTAPVPVPRDVEAVEAVINALDLGVSDAAEAHRTIVIGRLDEVQNRIGEVLGEQERMAQLIEAAG